MLILPKEKPSRPVSLNDLSLGSADLKLEIERQLSWKDGTGETCFRSRVMMAKATAPGVVQAPVASL